MFSRMQLLASTVDIASRFNTDVLDSKPILPKSEISGFDHALQPIILQSGTQLICSDSHWGLVPPDWRKAPEEIWNHTISAKLEYISKRYSWQKVSNNRCLVPATAYFEYRWNDPKGNSKTKYIIKDTSEELFALAGLFSVWRTPEGNLLRSFAVCTTMANETMEFVHNKDAAKNYHRMPVLLNREDEASWLDTSIPYMDFAYPNYRPSLTAAPTDDNPTGQTTLF
jgi:putative SOS response-associated peptidase YedK